MIKQEIIFLLRNILLLCCILLGLSFLNGSAVAQVTSILQLSDVKSGYWAFQALQTLVERYGCATGYNDRTFRGDRAATRYEFAETLDTCLGQLQQILPQTDAFNIVRAIDEDTQENSQEALNILDRALKAHKHRLELLEKKLELLEKN